MLLIGESLLVVSNISSLLKTDEKHWWLDRMYLQDAIRTAKRSIDPNTQVGALLVVPTGIGVVLRAWNCVPCKLIQAGYPIKTEDKNYCTEHAERKVIFDAVQNGLKTDGMTMYCTWASCAECSRCIINFGISRVVTFSSLVEKTHEKWYESVLHGIKMMRDCGVSVIGWRGDLGMECNLRFGGKQITEKDLL